MYGTTQEGHAVLVHVHGFLPYFYVNAPRGFTAGTCADFKNYLNVRVALTQTTFGTNAVADVSLVSRKNLMQYTGPEAIAFVRITAADLRSFPRIRDTYLGSD